VFILLRRSFIGRAPPLAGGGGQGSVFSPLTGCFGLCDPFIVGHRIDVLHKQYSFASESKTCDFRRRCSSRLSRQVMQQAPSSVL